MQGHCEMFSHPLDWLDEVLGGAKANSDGVLIFQ